VGRPRAQLESQANNATLVHAQPKHPPTNSELRQIVDLETSLFTAQSEDNLGGEPDRAGARGGPLFLAFAAVSSPGFNSSPKFNPNAFNLYSRWINASGPNAAARQSIAPRRNVVQQASHEHFRRARFTTFGVRI